VQKCRLSCRQRFLSDSKTRGAPLHLRLLGFIAVTVVVGCRFSDGVVLLADSRATWTQGRVEDRLQKLLPLGSKVVFAYAGDAVAADKIWRTMRFRIRAVPRRGSAASIILDLPAGFLRTSCCVSVRRTTCVNPR
jgi:Proteasome subunit